MRPVTGAAGRCTAFRQELRLFDERFSEGNHRKSGHELARVLFLMFIYGYHMLLLLMKWQFTNNKTVCYQ